ncbi:hypothetical protein A3F57_03340 [Candidatus Roizmanbacteria bacterium RIFCSPHIGHO2_12_FULL_36_11]|nr:MAG: hypothetical protein A3F57_03340 [Candidatus Roizmanbacteria bacterium RIFCSPHIGHO2_12_FULL_36_11]
MKKIDGITFDSVKLPLTNLHYMKYGKGEPLIIFPATISRLENWTNILKFLGQKYTAYFFELPGHGKSKKFTSPYKNELVAITYKDFINALGLTKASIFGFSFGGITALKTIQLYPEKVDSLFLISPCVSYKAINFSPYRLILLRSLLPFFINPFLQKKLIKIAHNEKKVNALIKFLQRTGKVEKRMNIKNFLLNLPLDTLDTLVRQLYEVLTVDFDKDGWRKHDHITCYFAMSINDPVLNYEYTREFLKTHFNTFKDTYFEYNFHQFPKDFDFNYLNNNFGHLLKLID